MFIHARNALLAEGWAGNVRLHVKGGMIAEIAAGVAAQEGDNQVDALLPAQGNLHSHSFQRAMAGMTEYRATGKAAASDNFWTWRELMYRFLDHLTPDDVEAIAALVFMEMQEAGFAAVGEFHYLHHQPGGAPYDAPDEVAQRILAAASQTGIGLTLLPVLYAFGGTGEQDLHGGQLRFGNDYNRFCTLVESIHAAARHAPPDTKIGVAPHSLRATNPRQMAAIAADFSGGPIHIHAAEQPKEVADTIAWLGARPVEWLLDTVGLGPNWCLIHATHMTADETIRFAQSGAVAGLCPLTESNLGDGIFNGVEYLAAGGAFGVGSDSCIRISVAGELATLEYSQRLKALGRNVLAVDPGSIGQQLYARAARGSAQALGRNAGQIAVGKLADLVAIDSAHPALCALTPAQLVDGWVFASHGDVVTDVWSAGRHAVKDGRHVAREAILNRYRSTMTALVARL
ncbi:MAG: formimidoylglutamate deiminase [Phyllobacteriaceae bacterium]|nr:formimidoylglutamate deiminase [Phyllobacteriaceae bacterium]